MTMVTKKTMLYKVFYNQDMRILADISAVKTTGSRSEMRIRPPFEPILILTLILGGSNIQGFE